MYRSTIVDAIAHKGDIRKIASRAKGSHNDTAKLYMVFLLWSRRGMSPKEIARATGINAGFAARAIERVRLCGFEKSCSGVNDDSLHSIGDNSVRTVAFIESNGDRFFTVKDFIEKIGVSYRTAKSMCEGLLHIGLLSIAGKGGDKTDKRAHVFFAPHLVKHGMFTYSCTRCDSLISVYYHTGAVVGGSVTDDRSIECVTCLEKNNPEDLIIIKARVWK